MFKRILVVLLVTLCSPMAWAEGEFRAAASEVVITPPAGTEMWGYSARKGVSTGTLDPLHARVLILQAGESRVGIVTLDLGRTFGEEAMQQVRGRVSNSAGIEQVLFFASHTHSGPVIEEGYPEGKVPEWEKTTLERIASALEESAKRTVPARIGTGAGQTLIGHNRIVQQPDGSVRMLWRNATRIPTSPVDDYVGVLRIDDESGAPIAVLVNYSCHPVVLGPDNLQFSADYAGAMARYVKETLEGNPTCMFLQGAPGDINPYFDKTPLEEDAVRLMRETGVQLGKEVVRVARQIQCEPVAKPSLKVSLEPLVFDIRWDIERLVASLEKTNPAYAQRYRERFSKPVSCPVTTLLINEEIALMGMPGEPFVSFAVDFRSRAPVKTSFFAGYANGFAGYFPTIQQAVMGGYGADSFASFTEVGAGETMVDHSIIELNQMLGRLKAEPSR